MGKSLRDLVIDEEVSTSDKGGLWSLVISEDEAKKPKQPAIPGFMDIGGQTQQTIQTAQQNIPKVQQQPITKPKQETGVFDASVIGQEVKPTAPVNKGGLPIGVAVEQDKKIGGSAVGAIYNTLVDLFSEVGGGAAYVEQYNPLKVFAKSLKSKIDVALTPGAKPSDVLSGDLIKAPEPDKKREEAYGFVQKARSSSSTKEQEQERAAFDITDGLSGKDIEAFLFNIPKQLGGIGLGAGTGGLTWVLQSINDNAAELAANPNAKDLTNTEKNGYILGQALTQAAFEKFSLGLIFKSTGLNKAAQRKVLSEVMDEFAKKGQKATAKELEDAIFKKTSQFASKAKRVGLGTATGFAVEGSTEGTQYIAGESLKLLLNKIKGKEIFNEEDIENNFFKNLSNSVAMGSAMGGPLGGLTAGFQNTNKSIRRQIAEANKPEDLQKVADDINAQVQEGNLAPQEAEQILTKAQEYTDIASKIPPETDTETKYSVIGGIEQRKQIETEIQKLEQEIQNVDPAFAKQKQDQLDLLKDKLGEVNDYIESLVTGEKPKYAERNGKYFKIDPETNEEIEITKGHYELANAANLNVDNPIKQNESDNKLQTDLVNSFVDKIVSGENTNTPEDLQFYENNKKEIENELQKRKETKVIQPKANEGTITESESIERRLPESEREVEPITTETESIAETKPIEIGKESANKIETDKAVMDGVKTNSVENENGDKILLPEEGFLIDSVYLKEGKEKGKGSGQQLYKKALDEHGVLYSHFPISEDALRVQDKLVEKGIAKIENITLSDGTELRKITKVSPTETKPIEPIQEEPKAQPKAQPIGDENIVNYEDAIKITPTSELTNPEKYGTDELGMEAKTAALRDEEKTPPKFNKYEVGTYAKDKYGDLYQLQNVPIEKIVLPEGEQKRKETIDKYKKWYKEGNEFPPAKGVENYAVYKGKVVINDGHHRIVAAKQLGLKEVPVWVSLTDPKNPARPIQDVSYHKSLSTKAQPIEQPEQQTQQPTVSNPQPIKEEVSITTEPETQYTEKGLKINEAKKVYASVKEVDDPTDARGLALQYIAGGGKISEQTLFKEVSTRRDERFAKTSKAEKTARDYVEAKGKTIEQIAHSIWDNLPDYLQERISAQDIRNELIDVVGSYNKRIDAAREFVDKYHQDKITARFTDDADLKYFQEKYKQEIEAEENEMRKWLESEAETQYEIEQSEEYINYLINQYEQEFKKENQQPAAASERQANQEISNRKDIEEKERAVKLAQSEYDKAQRELKSAEDKISQKQSTQQSLLPTEGVQKEMFGVGANEAKSILDPLRKKVKDTKAKLDKAENELAVEKDKENTSLFSETQPQEPIIAETKETTIKEQQGKVDTGAKKDLSTRAREYADKLLSGEETVLPDWLQASLPKGTKKQGISINEAFAQALKAFADAYDATKNFAQAVDEGFQKIKDWFDENKIPYNEAELKEKFAQDRQGEIPTESQPPPPSEPPVSEQGEGKGGRTDERRFSKQMLETEDLVPEAKEGVKETLEYAVQTNAMSIQEASEILKKVGLDEGVALVMDRNNDMNGGVRVVMAQAIIKSYNELVKNAPDQATKDFYLDKVIQVAKNVTDKLATDPGQMIQAFSLWSTLTPEAQLRYSTKEVGEIGKARKEKQKKNINNIGNKFKKANEEAAEEVFNDPEVKNTINKNDSERAKKARVKIAKARQRRENILKKYKGQKGKNLFSTGVPGLSPEGIEFVGEVALTYIQEGIANVELLVEKIKQNLKEVSGKDVPDELTEQITQIADDKLNRSDERLIGKELKEQKLSINDIVKQHYTVAEKAKKSLADKLVEKAGLTGEEAADLAAKVEAAFDRIATRKKKRILFQEKARFDRIKNGMKGANTVDPKTLQGEMIRYSNLGAFENDAFADMIAEKLGTGKLTPQEAQRIIDLSEKVQNAPEGSPKNDATEDLLAYRANLKGTNWAEIAQGAWYANVLSGYKTHEKNIVSTFFNVVGELSAQSLKNPTEAPFILYGFLKGARRGGLEGIHTLVTGRSPIHVKKVETPNVLERKEFKGGYFNPANWLKFVTRAMVAEDVLMFQGLKEARAYQLALREAKKYGAKKGEIWKAVDELLLNTKQRYDEALAQAKSEGLASTIDIKRRVYELMEASRPVPMTEDAYGFAAEGTFNHETQGTLGAMSNAIAAFVDMPIGGAQPLRFIVPFTRIITNVVNQALNYTPVGLVRAARGVRGFRSFENYAYAKSAYVKLTPEQRKTIIAKASLGIGLAAALYALSKIKDEDDEPLIEITGGGTGDYKKDQQLREAGWQEYSIKVGDTYWSYKLTPLIFMLGFFGNMNDKEKYAKTEDDATTLKQMELAMWRNFNLVGELSWINTAGTLLGALQEGAKNKEDITRSLEQSMKGFLVPQAYTQAAQEVQKIFNMPQKRVENAWQNMIQDIPIARNSLNDKINVLGDPIIRDVDVINSEVTPDPVLKFLLDNNGWIAPVNKNSMIVYKNGIERDITEDEYYEFSKVRGQLVKQKIQKLMQSNLYKVDEFKVKTLSKGTPEYKRKLQSELSKIAQEATDEAKNKLMPKDLYIEITEEVSSSIENILNTR